ncbi:MAG: hypothetical protein AAF206_25075 [Bacteroidota bacterium]
MPYLDAPKRIKNWQKLVLLLTLILFAAFVYLVLTPIPAPTSENVAPLSGVVEKIHSPCCQDLVFDLKDLDRTLYINRGLEKELDVEMLRQKLIGQEVDFLVVSYQWTPFDPSGKLAPVAEVRLHDTILYSGL